MSSVPEQLNDSVNAVAKALGVRRDEVVFVVSDMVREAIEEYFGDNPSEMIAKRIVEARQDRHKEALNELSKPKSKVELKVAA